MSKTLKRRLHKYTPEQLEFIKANCQLKRKELHRRFEERFEVKVPYNGIVALCTRQGWSNGNTGRFEKGHQLNKKYQVGDEFVDGYGYTVVVTELPGRAKFQQKHRWLWQQHNGPVPKDHYVTFKDGDKTNLNLDNLILISKRELAYMNVNYQRFSDKEKHLTFIAMSKLKCKTVDLMGTKKARRKREERLGRLNNG